MYTVINVINTLFDIYEFIIVAWCILSWIPRREGGFIDDLAQVVNGLVAPYMNIFRRFIPPIGGFDFSPIVGILALSVIQNVLVRLLIGL